MNKTNLGCILLTRCIPGGSAIGARGRAYVYEGRGNSPQ